ncbi:MAG: response regulator [Chloroflexi bacterium]|nr:response regulator [Chloroflexota bacterium]
MAWPTAQPGFEYLQTHTPDLILMDIHLPGTDGYTLTRQLRQSEQFAAVPIITLTANVTKEDEQKSQEAGANGFIQKPINVDSLPDQIRTYLAENERGRP